jgi:WD40 repeat protein
VVPGLNLIGKHTDVRACVDLQYWQAKGVMFLGTGDNTSFLAKSGGFFSFGKKKEPAQSPGCLVSLINGKKSPTDIGDYNFERAWFMDFQQPAGTLDWCEATGTLLCAEDSGSIHLITPDDSNLMKYSAPVYLKVHADRVNKIVYDETRKVIYSIGDDRKFKESSLEKKRIINEFEVSSKRPNCLFVNKEVRVAFVGDAEGNVKIIDLARNPPTCINNIKASTKDSVSCLHVRSNLIFCGCAESGKIPVYFLEDPKNSASHAVLKYTFTGYPGITCLKYWKEKGLVYVGHSNGVLSVFCKYISIASPFCTLRSPRRLQSTRRPHQLHQNLLQGRNRRHRFPGQNRQVLGTPDRLDGPQNPLQGETAERERLHR